MRLPINIEELLGGRAVEGDRIEYKTGWNPDAIYRSVCAFANDFDETGGGYIVVGVKEVNGRPVRPVIGIDPNQIEPIEKDMVGFNNLMQPYYQPRLYIEEADGQTILVIKVSAGERRPYKVPDQITAKQKTYNYYIRYNSSSIVPKGEYERELINLANTIETDEERTYFLIDIPCHPGFMKETLSVEQIGVKGDVKEPNVTKDVTKELTERQSVILEMITEDSFVTIPEMSLKTGVATRTIKRDIENLQSSGILTRKGGRKNGEWIVTELGMAMLEALKK